MKPKPLGISQFQDNVGISYFQQLIAITPTSSSATIRVWYQIQIKSDQMTDITSPRVTI